MHCWSENSFKFVKRSRKVSRSGNRFAISLNWLVLTALKQGRIQAYSRFNSSIHSHAKMPKLELKKFHGNPINWYLFSESFESAFHRSNTLAGVDKFNYLKSLLVGSAAVWLWQTLITRRLLISWKRERNASIRQLQCGNRHVCKETNASTERKMFPGP